MSRAEKRNMGPIYVMITGLLFSFGGLCIKMVPWNGLAINSFRCILSGTVVWIGAKVLGHRLHFNKHILLSALALAATNCLYTSAVKLTTAGAAIVIQFTVPVWTMLFGLILYHKKPRGGDILACICVFTGIAICFYEGLAAGRTAGNLLALLSGMTYSSVFMSNSAEDADPFSSSILGHYISVLFGLPWLLKADFSAMTPKSWLALIFMGIFQMGFSYIFLSVGLETTPPVTACLMTGIEPVLNPIWVALLYGEPITLLFALGGTSVLVSVILYQRWIAKHEEGEGYPPDEQRGAPA